MEKDLRSFKKERCPKHIASNGSIVPDGGKALSKGGIFAKW